MNDQEKTTETPETDLPVCTRSFDPESHRFTDEDEPCRDGEKQ